MLQNMTRPCQLKKPRSLGMILSAALNIFNKCRNCTKPLLGTKHSKVTINAFINTRGAVRNVQSITIAEYALVSSALA
jgi:hypothetical protein